MNNLHEITSIETLIERLDPAVPSYLREHESGDVEETNLTACQQFLWNLLLRRQGREIQPTFLATTFLATAERWWDACIEAREAHGEEREPAYRRVVDAARATCGLLVPDQTDRLSLALLAPEHLMEEYCRTDQQGLFREFVFTQMSPQQSAAS
jgi:hypothetical protein